jgi:hypothetical protein
VVTTGGIHSLWRSAKAFESVVDPEFDMRMLDVQRPEVDWRAAVDESPMLGENARLW